MRRTKPVVAIDGPAGAGKSTVTRRVAEALGYTRVDTGALYRAVAWLCFERGVEVSDEQAATEVARELAAPGAIALSSRGPEATVTVLGLDVSTAIRSQPVAQGASLVSAHPGVRAALLDIQRQLGRLGGVVLEGRDIGSVVFPNAEAKFFLTASVDVRAARRAQELESLGQPRPLEQVRDDVVKRDHQDTMRPVAPLVRPSDAVLVDSSSMSIDQVVSEIVTKVRKIEAQLGSAS